MYHLHAGKKLTGHNSSIAKNSNLTQLISLIKFDRNKNKFIINEKTYEFILIYSSEGKIITNLNNKEINKIKLLGIEII